MCLTQGNAHHKLTALAALEVVCHDAAVVQFDEGACEVEAYAGAHVTVFGR